nr:hypothetical protein [Tanacetum cinerariifolium]
VPVVVEPAVVPVVLEPAVVPDVVPSVVPVVVLPEVLPDVPSVVAQALMKGRATFGIGRGGCLGLHHAVVGEVGLAHNLGVRLAYRLGRDAVLLVVGHLSGAAAVGFVNSALHRARHAVGVEDNLTPLVTGGPAHGLKSVSAGRAGSLPCRHQEWRPSLLRASQGLRAAGSRQLAHLPHLGADAAKSRRGPASSHPSECTRL